MSENKNRNACVENIGFRKVDEADKDFLYRLYADTRAAEIAQSGWSEEQVTWFLTNQFQLQHSQYMESFKEASFEIILFEDEPVGRLYVDRRAEEIRIIDIALLSECQGRGIGSKILDDLLAEAESKKIPLNVWLETYNPFIPVFEAKGFIKKDEQGPNIFMGTLKVSTD